jgi:HEAT repeat protein
LKYREEKLQLSIQIDAMVGAKQAEDMKEMGIQLFIIDALTKLGDKKAGEALRFEVRHGELESQRAATSALGRLQSDWPIPILVRITHSYQIA